METIGHETIRERFRRTIERGRLASTYLFVGPEGIGKRTFAIDLASALLCHDPHAASRVRACGRCESCRLAAAAGHPDLISIAKPAGRASLPIDLFLGRAEHRNREGLCHEIALKPFLSTRRIAVIDDADHLGVEAANCLLKTLEEPPPRSVLILIGTSLSKQLPTIRSRCQTVRFAPLAKDELAGVLARIAESRGDAAGEGFDAETLAGAGGGSVTKAIAAADTGLTAFREEIDRALSRGSFDPIRLAAAVAEQTQAAGNEPAARRDRLRTILGYAVDHYRARLRSDAGGGGVPNPRLVERLEATLDAEESLGKNANQALLIQTWLTGLAR